MCNHPKTSMNYNKTSSYTHNLYTHEKRLIKLCKNRMFDVQKKLVSDPNIQVWILFPQIKKILELLVSSIGKA
jgi:hypothetical protein